MRIIDQKPSELFDDRVAQSILQHKLKRWIEKRNLFLNVMASPYIAGRERVGWVIIDSLNANITDAMRELRIVSNKDDEFLFRMDAVVCAGLEQEKALREALRKNPPSPIEHPKRPQGTKAPTERKPRPRKRAGKQQARQRQQNELLFRRMATALAPASSHEQEKPTCQPIAYPSYMMR